MKMTSGCSNRLIAGLAVALATAALGASCSSDAAAAKHQVFFVGYVYDGASGARLATKDITAISIKYRDQVIRTTIEDDGRFVSVDPLPTWQDYTVYVGAAGYRPFVSNNPGFDVPKSLQMTDGVATLGTVQTFQFDVHLFPMALQSPAVALTIEKSDALVTVPPPARAAGTLRLRPESSSVLDRSATSGGQVWFNDEDLLNQTITMPFTDGAAAIAVGTLVYGVTYEIAIFDVDGYQPFVGTNTQALTGGAVTSLSVTVQADAKAPLRILGTDADKCMPPTPSSTTFGAAIDLTFSEEVEAAAPTLAEAIDSGVAISVGSNTTSYCPLNTSTDPTKQERGTMIAFNGKVMTLSFNPSIGLSTITTYGTTCATPPAITAVIYGGLSTAFVQPKGDPSRKRSLAAMLGEITSPSFPTQSTSLSCPQVTSSSSF